MIAGSTVSAGRTFGETVAVMIDAEDRDHPAELVKHALETSQPDRVLVIAVVRPLGFTTDAAIADRYVMRRERLARRMESIVGALGTSGLTVQGASLAGAIAGSGETQRKAAALGRRHGATLLVRRTVTGEVVADEL